MLAKELICILAKNPEAEIYLRYETLYVYSELTTGTEDVVVKLDDTAISQDEGRITLCADLCEAED